MKFDAKQVLQELLQNPKVAKVVKKHELTEEQQIEAIPILYEIKNEPKNAKFHTDLEITSLGGVEKVIIYKNLHNNHFEQNILTQQIEHIDFDKDHNFYKTEERRILVSKLSKYVLTDQKGKGLYIYGKMGVGKTFICKRIIKLMAQKGKKVGLVNLPNLNLAVRNSFNDSERYLLIVNILKKVNYLFIDDIGSETVSSWFRDDFLFPILDYRSENNKITCFTSNYSLKKLEEVERKTNGAKYLDYDKSQRLMDRIKALSEPLKLVGINYRTK